ncbi:MAG: hypothetical protein QG657_1620 [Acidobacteriota bacterium]|nr:hypothetical protein [Planctomycetota bacterium]MDQ1276412.1 hypothetical protein [Euryarchaeota archaeon]MDQ1351318.1 hypothetical protein [Acidobacteriota bacterium]
MQDLATQILNAQTEEDVDKIIENAYFSEGSWKSLGGIDKNYGLVENQQSHPVGALVEKITNAWDAILMKKCVQAGIIPTSPEAPDSMEESLTQFFGEPKDREKNQNAIAQLIKIEADGGKLEPNITIIDEGIGQEPKNFEGTFLSLLRVGTGKEGVRFVQGMYDMGSSGALHYCGKPIIGRGYELIISRSAISKGSWGWTLIRKNREKEKFEYFVHQGQIPSFECEQFYRKADGTIIKLFNYQLLHKSTSTTDLRNNIDLFVMDAHLPIKMVEKRASLNPSVEEITTTGNRGKLLKQPQLIEKRFVVERDFGRCGMRKIEFFVFKDDKELADFDKKRGKSGEVSKRIKRRFTTDKSVIFFTINGQTHGSLGKSFIKTRCKKPLLEKDLFIHIDFSGIKKADQTDLFMPSRDKMRETDVTIDMENIILECIRDDENLKELHEARAQRLTEKSVSDFDFVNKFFSKLVTKNPAFIKYLKSGGKVPNPRKHGVVKKGEYKPSLFPTFFKIKNWDEQKGEYSKDVPINSKGYNLSFELNAPNDYLDREEYPGTMSVKPDVMIMRKLMDGTLLLRFKPLDAAKEGDSHHITISVSVEGKESLTQDFKVKYVAPLPEPEPGTHKRERTTKSRGPWHSRPDNGEKGTMGRSRLGWRGYCKDC